MKKRYKFAIGSLLVLTLAVGAVAVMISRTAPCEPRVVPEANSKNMQAVIARCYGSSEILEVTTVEKPVPAPNEVLVKVEAASVNPLDWHYMRGSPYLMRFATGLNVPSDTRVGVDFAGTVHAVGAKVTRFKPGDDVFGGRSGAFAEYLVIPEDRGLAVKPANVSFEDAAAAPIAGITALQALRDLGKLREGQHVLINGASGGVGTFAVQIAKAMGATVTGVCSTRNRDRVLAAGADHVIDYKKDDYTQSDIQYDLIVDNVGNHSPSAILDVLKPDGRLVIVGGPKGDWIGPFLPVLKANLLGPFVDQQVVTLLAELNAADLATLADFMRAKKVVPVIDRHFDLSAVPEAIAYSETGRARGKIIIDID